MPMSGNERNRSKSGILILIFEDGKNINIIHPPPPPTQPIQPNLLST